MLKFGDLRIFNFDSNFHFYFDYKKDETLLENKKFFLVTRTSNLLGLVDFVVINDDKIIFYERKDSKFLEANSKVVQ